MNLVQLYETTIRDTDSNLAISFIVVPNRSLPQSGVELVGSQGSRRLDRNQTVVEQLGLRVLARVLPMQLENAIAGLLLDAKEIRQPIYDTSFEAALSAHLERLVNGLDGRVGPQERQLSSYVVHNSVVPFEQSPLQAVSLQSLSKASPVALGAFMGFVVAGSSPMLFIAVPAGIILCGAAAGVAKGLENGLKDRLQYLIGKAGTQSSPPRPPAKKSPARKRGAP